MQGIGQYEELVVNRQCPRGRDGAESIRHRFGTTSEYDLWEKVRNVRNPAVTLGARAAAILRQQHPRPPRTYECQHQVRDARVINAEVNLRGDNMGVICHGSGRDCDGVIQDGLRSREGKYLFVGRREGQTQRRDNSDG